jgi:uncharacterized protein YdeI (BOF family)
LKKANQEIYFFDNEEGRITVGIIMDNIIHASGKVRRLDHLGIYAEVNKHTHKLRVIKDYIKNLSDY